MAAGLQMARGDNALTLTAAGAGANSSGPLGNAGEAAYVLAMAHVTAATGTGPTLTVALEESDTGSSGWTAVPGGAGAAIAGVGNQVICGAPTKNFVRVTATVAGTTPAVTGRVAVLMFAE
jgi:hypothetical protein